MGVLVILDPVNRDPDLVEPLLDGLLEKVSPVDFRAVLSRREHQRLAGVDQIDSVRQQRSDRIAGQVFLRGSKEHRNPNDVLRAQTDLVTQDLNGALDPLSTSLGTASDIFVLDSLADCETWKV